jgi:hypothetical protein
VGSVPALMTIPWLGCLETGRLLTRAKLGGLLLWTRWSWKLQRGRPLPWCRVESCLEKLLLPAP